MATIVSNLIGVGAPLYTTAQSWEDACPADLVTANQIWQGQVMNQEIVSASRILSIGSSTIVSADCYVELTAAAGASFQDHANKATNPLRYDATKGAALRYTGDTHATVTIAAAYTRISKLQISNTSTAAAASGAINCTGSGVQGVDIDACICESSTKNTAVGTVMLRGTGSKIRNSVILLKDATVAGAHALGLTTRGSAYNCVVLALNSTVNAALVTSAEVGTIKNTYVGGATAPHSGTWGASNFINCMSDIAATGFTTAALLDCFENITPATLDLRSKTGSPLRDAGIADAATAPFDIYGTSRPQNGSYDIGAWEAVVADTQGPTLTSPTGASTGTTSASGTVFTNENTGTLYYLASINATETASTVKANGATQAVTTSGTKTVTVNGLTASTTYYMHYVHRDGSGNDSDRMSSAAFTTSAPGDSQPPALTAVSIAATGSTTASGTISTNEPNGALYRYVSTNATESASTIKAANLSQAVTTAGSQSVSIGGLSASVTYYAHFVHRDSSGNDSAVLTSAAFTTQAASGSGILTTAAFKNGADQVLANLTGLVVKVCGLPSMATVATFTNETTDANGINVVSSVDIVSGTKYAHITINSLGTVIGAEILLATG